MKRRHPAKDSAHPVPLTLQTLATRVAALERDVAMLYLTGQLRQALRRIAALEAK